MRKLAFLMALLVMAVFIVGCAAKEPLAKTETPTTTTPTEQAPSTPAETPQETAPATSEQLVPDDLIEANPDPGALNDVSVDTRVLG
jgi:hypothetical protein